MIYSSGNDIVDQMARWNPKGIVIPHTWFMSIQKSGKPYMPAIVALAEIVYWYRPSEVREEETSVLLGYRKRFKADKLQKSANGLAETFGFTKKQMLDAMNYLKKEGYITVELRTITTDAGVKLNNVRFIEIDMNKIEKMTYPVPQKLDTITSKSQGSNSQVTGVSPGSHTNTKSTCTEITSTSSSTTTDLEKNEDHPGNEKNHEAEKQELKDFRRVEELYMKCGWGMPSPLTRETLIYDLKDYGVDIVCHAIQIAGDRNAKSYSYTKGIYRTWNDKGLKTIERVIQYEEAEVLKRAAAQKRKPGKGKPDYVGSTQNKRVQSSSKGNNGNDGFEF